MMYAKCNEPTDSHFGVMQIKAKHKESVTSSKMCIKPQRLSEENGELRNAISTFTEGN